MKCVFCNGFGIAKFIDLDKKIPDGKYSIKELLTKYGKYTECCEGCRILN